MFFICKPKRKNITKKFKKISKILAILVDNH